MSQRGFIDRQLVGGISAAAEACFPENELGAPDWRTTDLVERMLEYLDELPPDQRRLLCMLFVFVELGAVLLVLGFRRFSRIPRDRRTQVVRRWRRSKFFPLRVLGDALKASTTMIYMSHPSVVTYIGEYRACERPLDSVQLPTRPEALNRGVEG